jgi:hypothetical protein
MSISLPSGETQFYPAGQVLGVAEGQLLAGTHWLRAFRRIFVRGCRSAMRKLISITAASINVSARREADHKSEPSNPVLPAKTFPETTDRPRSS